MKNYKIKTDLLKVKGAFVTNIKGRTETKQCLCIPITGSGLYLGAKGCYLSLTAFEMQNPSYGDTHLLKVTVDKETYQAMSEEERRQQPILGGMHEMEQRPEQMAVTETVTAAPTAAADEDLPF